MQFTAEMIASFLGGTVEGDKSAAVSTVSKIEEALPGSLAFLSNPKYEQHIYTTGASIVIVNKEFVPQKPVNSTLVKVDDAYSAFAKLLDLYVASMPQKEGVSPLAFAHPAAKIADNVYLGEFCCIGQESSVGEGSKIYPQVYVGDRVTVGRNVKLFPGVRIYDDCRIGDNVIVHAGAVIGADGFGFAPVNGEYKKIPQIGNVVLEDDVEIGANTCIDRATMGSTVIKKGTKLDNLIQIGHNVVVGENSVFAAQTGVAGSTKIGRGCMFGGQVGVVGHLSIADGVKVASQSGVEYSIENKDSGWMGSPAVPIMQHHRTFATYKTLPELRARIARLEEQIKKLSDGK